MIKYKFVYFVALIVFQIKAQFGSEEGGRPV